MNDDYYNSARACLYLVERYAARMAIMGGGHCAGSGQSARPAVAGERDLCLTTYHKLLSIPDTAKAMDRSHDWVRRIIRGAGCPPQKRGPKVKQLVA